MIEIGGRATLTMIGTTDAVTLLRQELRRLEALLDQLHSGGDPEVVAELAAPLRDHIDVTEGIVFPAIHGRAQDGVPLELLANGTQQHGDLLRLLDEPAAADADGDGAAATAGVLEEQLRRHLEYEEIGILPAAEELLDDGTLLDSAAACSNASRCLGPSMSWRR
jgi:hemerythrin-like domain-containing protein